VIDGFTVISEVEVPAIVAEVDGLGIGAAGVAAKALVATPITPPKVAQIRLRLNMPYTFIHLTGVPADAETFKTRFDPFADIAVALLLRRVL
jgi:hypothetical protein